MVCSEICMFVSTFMLQTSMSVHTGTVGVSRFAITPMGPTTATASQDSPSIEISNPVKVSMDGFCYCLYLLQLVTYSL